MFAQVWGGSLALAVAVATGAAVAGLGAWHDRAGERRAGRIRVARAVEDQDAVRGFTEPTHRAGSWARERRVAARIEATRLGLDIRYVVTNIATGAAAWLYAEFYCQRGQAENLIKLHKAQLASDRTSCRAATANQIGSSCTPPPTGSSSPCARRSPRRTRSPRPSSPPSACGCSRSRPASPRARAVSASLSPPPARTPPCSARLPPNSGPRRAEHRGRAARQDHPALPTPAQLPITPRRPPAKRSHDQDQARHHWAGHSK